MAVSDFVLGFEIEGTFPRDRDPSELREYLDANGLSEVEIGFDRTASREPEAIGIELRTPPLPAETALQVFGKLCRVAGSRLGTHRATGIHLTVSSKSPLRAIHGVAVALTDVYLRGIENTGRGRARGWSQRIVVAARALARRHDPRRVAEMLAEIVADDRYWSVRERRRAPMLEFRAFGGADWSAACRSISAKMRMVLRLLDHVAHMTEEAVKEAAARRVERSERYMPEIRAGVVEEAIDALGDHVRDPDAAREVFATMNPETVEDIGRAAGGDPATGAVYAGLALFAHGHDPDRILRDIPPPTLGRFRDLMREDRRFLMKIHELPPGRLGDWFLMIGPRDAKVDVVDRRPALEDFAREAALRVGLGGAIAVLGRIPRSESARIVLSELAEFRDPGDILAAIDAAADMGRLPHRDANLLRGALTKAVSAGTSRS